MNVPILENERVKLTLLDLSNYKLLSEIAQQPNLVQYSPSKIDTTEDLKNYVQTAIDGYYHNNTMPFIIFDKAQQAYAGSTRFGLIDVVNKVLHIGWTWIGKQFQGTGLNKNIKFLMLQYAFEDLQYDKVEFRIDERNVRSRKAVENIGATLEGILRKDKLMLDGFKRSTCCYGILKEEWLQIKKTIFLNFY
ncbi:GNAT family N-acetyltransferase [Changchengzhania lutea]|uniref:GNAT family N-acetyltransferase n=1 Tax=Changchengzhania lutea TaxID=2049305 RepID=UPI00115CC60B|nr:GNAT family protein [Changchengzhania lutea]